MVQDNGRLSVANYIVNTHKCAIVRIRYERMQGKHHLSLNSDVSGSRVISAQSIESCKMYASLPFQILCTCYLYICVYVTHNIYAHWTQLLMFIYIQIINLFYSYVLFYANAIKASSEHDLLYYAWLWQKLQHGKTIMLMLSLSRLMVGHGASPELESLMTLAENTVKSIWQMKRIWI